MNDGHITAADLYKTIDTKKLGKIPGKLNKNTPALRKYLGSIYMELMNLVVDDIMENNANFKLSLMFERKGSLQIKPIRDERFKYLMQNGSFQGLDFLKTDFTGYGLFYLCDKTHDRFIAVNKDTKKRIIDQANAGMKYF
jgi:hypothetical protein